MGKEKKRNERAKPKKKTKKNKRTKDMMENLSHFEEELEKREAKRQEQIETYLSPIREAAKYGDWKAAAFLLMYEYPPTIPVYIVGGNLDIRGEIDTFECALS